MKIQRAIGYMILAAVCFTAMNSLLRSIDHFPAFQIVFFRAIGSVVCCAAFFSIAKVSPKGNQPGWLIFRGIVGVTSMVLFFRAVQLMPIGTVVSLRYLSPFFAAALAVFFLGEKMKPLQWVCFLAAFIGVMLIKGFDDRITLIGLCIILTSAFLSGIVFFIIRKLGTTEHPVVVVNYFMVVATLVGGSVTLFNWTTPQGNEWILLISMGIIGFVAQYLMTKAIQNAPATLITPFKYLEVIFTLIAGYLIFNEGQGLVALLGMGLIVVALLSNLVLGRSSSS